MKSRPWYFVLRGVGPRVLLRWGVSFSVGGESYSINK